LMEERYRQLPYMTAKRHNPRLTVPARIGIKIDSGLLYYTQTDTMLEVKAA